MEEKALFITLYFLIFFCRIHMSYAYYLAFFNLKKKLKSTYLNSCSLHREWSQISKKILSFLIVLHNRVWYIFCNEKASNFSKKPSHPKKPKCVPRNTKTTPSDSKRCPSGNPTAIGWTLCPPSLWTVFWRLVNTALAWETPYWCATRLFTCGTTLVISWRERILQSWQSTINRCLICYGALVTAPRLAFCVISPIRWPWATWRIMSRRLRQQKMDSILQKWCHRLCRACSCRSGKSLANRHTRDWSVSIEQVWCIVVFSIFREGITLSHFDLFVPHIFYFFYFWKNEFFL